MGEMSNNAAVMTLMSNIAREWERIKILVPDSLYKRDLDRLIHDGNRDIETLLEVPECSCGTEMVCPGCDHYVNAEELIESQLDIDELNDRIRGLEGELREAKTGAAK